MSRIYNLPNLQSTQEQKSAPESAGAGIFSIGASRDRLVERLHEPEFWMSRFYNNKWLQFKCQNTFLTVFQPCYDSELNSPAKSSLRQAVREWKSDGSGIMGSKAATSAFQLWMLLCLVVVSLVAVPTSWADAGKHAKNGVRS